MAKIDNQGAYPLKSNPVSTDTVLGNDSEDSGKTVLFEISALQATLGATIYSQDNIIPVARQVSHNAGLTFLGAQVASEFLVQHTSGPLFRVNQNGVFSTALGVGASAIDASAVMQVDSTTQGFLLPRMTTAQRDAIVSPANGLEIYNLDNLSVDYYHGRS